MIVRDVPGLERDVSKVVEFAESKPSAGTNSGPKRRRLHPEQGCRAILAIHLAVAPRQGTLDVGTLHFLDFHDRQDTRRVILRAAGRLLLWRPLLGFSEFEFESSS